MSDIFICYSRTDSAVANRLTERLRAEGWSVFMDVQTHVGKRWHKEIEREMHAAKALVALWSAQSRESDFVLEEAEYGKRHDILFPALIEKVDYPYGFSRIETADLIGWGGESDHPGLGQLLESLRLHLGEASPSGPEFETGASVGHTTIAALKPGETFRDKLKIGGEGPMMAIIPAGSFLMGSPPDEKERSKDEGPQHQVHIARPFALGVYAVTFEEYDRFAEETQRAKPDDAGWGRGRRPAINISLNNAQDYCVWLSKNTGNEYRLPSEAEWEYACRAGTTTPFHTGERLTTNQANFNGKYTYDGPPEGEYREQTVPVGTFSPNAFGLYDMHGNVWEWCQDRWHDNYDGSPEDGSAWEEGKNLSHVLRGGSWFDPSCSCRAAQRLMARGGYTIGFRVCCDAPLG